MIRTALATLLVVTVSAPFCQADDKTKDAQPERYLLRYKFEPGQQIRWKVTHIASTETRIKGDTQRSRSSSVSTKVWEIQEVSQEGQVKLVHTVADVDMWQKVTDRDEIRYNSKTDKEPPLMYQAVADTVGVPMYEVLMDNRGDISKRVSFHKQTEKTEIGLEEVTILLPEKPVRVGSTWHAPGELRIRTESGRVEKIKIRRLYKLKKVNVGLATIDVKTEVLSIVRDEKVKLHLMQRLNDGFIKFDIDAGMIHSRQIDWDETVYNFSGAESQMHYMARITEEFLPPERSAQKTPKSDKK